MKLPPFLAGIFGKGTGSLVDSVKNLADEFFESKEEKAAFAEKAAAEINRHMEIMQEHANQSAQMYLNDVANARSMQIAALNQLDNFSKRFVYFLAAFMIVAATAFGVLLCFKVVPEQNKRLIEMFVDVFLFAGAFTVLGFFFGSSKGSEDKQKQLMDMVKEKE